MDSSQNPYPKRDRLLVVGGTGRLGRLLQRAFALSDGGIDIVWQRRSGVAATDSGVGVEFFDPLSQPQAYRRAAKTADVILNLAGVTAGTEAELALNTDLALAAVAAAGGRLVLLASSAAIYGADAGPLSEDCQARPISPYGRAKHAMERAALAVAQATGAKVCCLRIGNVAGADALLGGAVPRERRLLDTFATGATPRRSYIGPSALARALQLLVTRAAKSLALPNRLNLALPGTVAMADLLGAKAEPWRARAAPVNAIAEVCLDVNRAVALGLVPDAMTDAAAIWADLATTLKGRPA